MKVFTKWPDAPGGALLCAYAVGAECVFAYVRGESALAYDRLCAALADARRHTAVGDHLFGAAFAAFGGARSTRTRVFSVSGRVRRPGNYDIELHHTTFRDLIFDPELGGAVIGDRPITAFFPDASFPWLGPEHLDLRLDIDDVAAAGSSLAAGPVVLDDTVCPIRVAARLVRFFAEESCGKCTPCREGAPWLEKIMGRIVHGYGRIEDLALLEDLGTRMGPGTTISALGPSTVAPISSTLTRFRDHHLEHVRIGGCPLEAPARAA